MRLAEQNGMPASHEPDGCRASVLLRRRTSKQAAVETLRDEPYV